MPTQKSKMLINVFIADRNEKSSARTIKLLEEEEDISVVGVARNVLEVRSIANFKPQILLLNLNLPN